MADLQQPTTGFVNNGSLVQYGADNVAAQWDYISLSKPTRPWRISLKGDLPTSKDGVDMSVSFFEGTLPLFSAMGTWNLQGQSSLNSLKKNYKIKLKNAVTGNKLKVRIGDWFPLSGLVLKGYGTDRTLLRDTITTEIWRHFHRDEAGRLAPEAIYSYQNDQDLGMKTSALFSTAGFPCELWCNGEFLGLYVLRSDNDNDQYLIDSSNPKHFLAQPDHATTFWQTGNYNFFEWEIYSPDPVSDDSISFLKRFLSWTSGCINGSINPRDTYRSYIDLTSFIDYMLLNDVVVSFDSIVNNFMLCSWNAAATSGIVSIYPYDEDETFGVMAAPTTVDQADPYNVGWVMKRDKRYGGQDPIFFDMLHKYFRPEIRARWRQLRDKNRISGETINRIILNQSNLIDSKLMKKDLQNWPMNGETGIGNAINISDQGKKWSVNYIMDYAKRRIQWLDQQFRYYG